MTRSPAAERPISSTRRRQATDGKRDPERTRRNLLDAAYNAFAALGYNGATVERICRRAGVSKQMLSHHFGSKKGIHLAVLEQAYAGARRHDLTLCGEPLQPDAALRAYVGATFDYLARNRAFVTLQADENISRGRHIRELAVMGKLYDPLIAWLGELLASGVQAGAFRAGIDPRQLYMSISAECYFYFSNAHTLSAAFALDLMRPDAVAARRAHVIEFVGNAVRSSGADMAGTAAAAASERVEGRE